MSEELAEVDFQRFWRRLQQLGLNAYESRSYLVLLGHPKFKALELAARAHVPRQKIYEVLDSLVEKGFAQVIQEKTKLFPAISPDQAIPSFVARRTQAMEQQLADQSRAAYGMVEYLEFSRPPYAVDPLDAELVIQARERGVNCRLLVEHGTLDATHEKFLADYQAAGAQVRQIDKVPMKMAVLDARQGLIALLDPVITKPTWTSVVFDHAGMAEAMKGLFEDYWRRATSSGAGGAGRP